MNEKILVVDDEQAIVDLIKLELEFEGYRVETAYDGQEAVEKALSWRPDLIVLDIMLPKMNGYDVCKKLVPLLNVPIILLTAKTDIVDKVLGLELGAEDYLTKPFDNRELLARIKVRLRHSSHSQPEEEQPVLNDCIQNGALIIRLEERVVTLEGKEVHLTPKEFDLLYLMASNLEHVFPREALLEKIWGYDYFGDTRTVDMHIQRIRRKIDNEPHKFIQTVFGIGYKMRKV